MYESVGVDLLKDSILMGTFPTPLPPTAHHIATVNMISTMPYQSFKSSDPWIVPSPMKFNVLGDTMPLSLAETPYVAIQSASPSPENPHLLAPDAYSMPSWLDSLSSVIDYISKFSLLMNLLWKFLALTAYLGMITIIDPLFFHLWKKSMKTYTLSSP
jgi:hypothetical protein